MPITQVNLYEAKTQLSSLVERAAQGEVIVIAKSGQPLARLVALSSSGKSAEPEPLPFGQNLLGISFLSPDWEDDLPPEIFENAEEDNLYLTEAAK